MVDFLKIQRVLDLMKPGRHGAEIRARARRTWLDLLICDDRGGARQGSWFVPTPPMYIRISKHGHRYEILSWTTPDLASILFLSTSRVEFEKKASIIVTIKISDDLINRLGRFSSEAWICLTWQWTRHFRLCWACSAGRSRPQIESWAIFSSINWHLLWSWWKNSQRKRMEAVRLTKNFSFTQVSLRILGACNLNSHRLIWKSGLHHGSDVVAIGRIL